MQERHVIWRATGLVVLAIVILAGAVLVLRPSGTVPPPALRVAAHRGVSPALVGAADLVGFRPHTEPGVGLIEGKPASAARPSANPNLIPVGEAAPGFRLETPQQTRVSLASLRGKTVLLEFFATWCPHCQAEAPHLRRMIESLPRSRYAFVSVNADGEDAASIFAFHRYFGLPFPALLDPSSQPGSFRDPGGPGPVSRRYGIETFPTFYVLDAHGRITWRSDGEQPDALLRRELRLAAQAAGRRS
jgi:peroxiredoxin